jgi:hypothetical protein
MVSAKLMRPWTLDVRPPASSSMVGGARPQVKVGRGGHVVKSLVGHGSISATIRHYARIMPDALRSAEERLPFHGVLRTYRLRLAGESGGGLGEALLRPSLPRCYGGHHSLLRAGSPGWLGPGPPSPLAPLDLARDEGLGATEGTTLCLRS